MKTLLYFGPSGIGDWCFIWPSIPALLKQEGCDQLHIVIPYENAGNQLLKDHPLVHDVSYLERKTKGAEILTYGLRWLQLLFQIRHCHYSSLAVSYLSNQVDFLLLAALSGIPNRIGRILRLSLLSRSAFTQHINVSSELGKVRIHAAYIHSNPPTNTASESLFPDVKPLDMHKTNWPSSTICLAVGGGRDARWRFWPAEHYRNLILKNPDKHFILLGGGDDDQEQAQKIMRSPAPDNVSNRVNRININEALSTIKSASATVGNDTGLTNISTVLGTPTLTIYGPSDPALTGPALLGSEFISHPIECSPCFNDTQDARIARNCTHRRCLISICPERVSTELEKLLTQN